MESDKKQEQIAALAQHKFPENGAIRVYNQFPRRYPAGLPEMIEDLPRIAQMGFNVVWINPIQLTGKVLINKGSQTHPKYVKGSLYAMADDEIFNDDFFPKTSDHKIRVELVKKYTSTAKSLGLMPIFDLVLNHVGKDTPLSKDYAKFLEKGSERWPDILPFDYKTLESRKHIIEKLWQPFIEKYIKIYGFCGVRVDAIVNVNTDLQRAIYKIINDSCSPNKPIILGELMAMNPLGEISKLKGLGFTHILSPGVFYWNSLKDQAPNWLYSQVHGLQEITQESNTISNQSNNNNASNKVIKGGVTGFSGNHDVGTLKGAVILFKEGKNLKALKGKFAENEPLKPLKWMEYDDFKECVNNDYTPEMKERVFRIAFTCHGGWYLLAGDEFGVPHRPKVFDDYKEIGSSQDKWRTNNTDDISSHIQLMNYILSKMPKTCLGDKISHESLEFSGEKLPLIIRTSASAPELRVSIICLSIKGIENLEDLIKTLIQQHKKSQNIEFFCINQNKLLFCGIDKNQFTDITSDIVNNNTIKNNKSYTNSKREN